MKKRKTNKTKRHNLLGKISFLLFLLTALAVSTVLVKNTTVWQKFAEEKSASAVFTAVPQKTLNRIWPNFSQGGEEQKLMLKPGQEKIKLLQPDYIRIDHIFDFPDLDKRVEEIIDCGARPFLSLSYFPLTISEDLTKFPTSLEKWGELITQTVQKYSGKNERNLLNVYYEVWNEPDLFGKMTPEQYYSLYLASVIAAERCQNCNSFKIGGPAITTLKKDWMEKFLSLAGQNNVRLDFVSWHSYQMNPGKTLWEAETLKTLGSFTRFFPSAELIISEWGSVPEVSPLHDSYFDASHTVWAIEKLKNAVDKVFTFELVDGPNPEGKEYWGRWGLLTDDAHGLSPKPRYYPFLYLSKLLHFEMKPEDISPNITAIASTDEKESYAVVISRQKGNLPVIPTELILNQTLPGVYLVNNYFLGSGNNPLSPQPQTITSNGALKITYQLSPHAVVLSEMTRISPALIPAPGKTNSPDDSSAKVTAVIPPLIFIWKHSAEINQGAVSFWFKASWNEGEIKKHTLIESKDGSGNGFAVWLESSARPEMHFGRLSEGAVAEEEKILTGPLSKDIWHQVSFRFDNLKKIAGIKFDDQQLTVSLPTEITTDSFIYLGNNTEKDASAEGFIDDLTIEVNGGISYQKNFN